MSNAAELFDSEMNMLINKAHKAGMNYWEIFKVLYRVCETLIMQSEAEYIMKGGRNGS